MSPAQLAAFHAFIGRELTGDEQALGDAREDMALAVSISAGLTQQIPIPRAAFAQWCGATGLRSVIEDKAHGSGDPLRPIALTLLDFLQGGVSQEINLADPRNQQMLGAWQAAGAITSQQAADLQAMAIAPRVISVDEVSNLLNGA